MKILVLVKEVPDMTRVKFDSERGVVNRAGAPAEINPFDENALQAAINLKRQYDDVEVTVLTMGPPCAEKSLRSAYSRGADRLILLTDSRFGGSDTFATSKIISRGIKQCGEFDLIICGEKSVDGDTAQVGAEVAEFLGIPHSYYVDNIVLGENSATVSVENIASKKQIREMTYPCLVSVTKNVARPELATVKRKLESLDAEVRKLNLDDIDDLDREECGGTGSPTKVKKVVVPKLETRETHIFREDIQGFTNALENCLKEKGII